MAELPPEAREGMQSDIAQMDAIIAQFLDYAKPTEQTSFMLLDVSAMLEEVAHEATRLPDVRVGTGLCEGAQVMGNATDLKRVFNNLVENARRYGKTPGTDIADIDIHCTLKGRQVIIEFQDHGVGVPEDQLTQLLKPFTRLDTARSQANGAGLGLAIVDRVLQKHEGELLLRNREGGGLIIRIVLNAA